LVRHLLEYRQFKRAATELRSREDEGNRLFVRPPTAVDLGELTQKQPEFGELDVLLLQKALKRALARIPVEPPPPKVQPYTVTVAERIETVRSLLGDARLGDASTTHFSFSGLLDDSSSRLEIIVTFLAVLELVKQRELVAEQDATFGEIVLILVDKAEQGVAEEGAIGASDVENADLADDADELAAASEPE
jgi:segregation and condensation protein A